MSIARLKSRKSIGLAGLVLACIVILLYFAFSDNREALSGRRSTSTNPSVEPKIHESPQHDSSLVSSTIQPDSILSEGGIVLSPDELTPALSDKADQARDWFPIESQTLSHLLEEVVVRAPDSISQDQTNNLLSSLGDNMLAVQSNNPDEMIDDLLQGRYKFDHDFIRLKIPYVSEYYKYLGKSYRAPNDSKQFIRDYVETVLVFKKRENYNTYSDISVESSNINIHIASELPKSTQDEYQRLLDLGAMTARKGFSTHHSFLIQEETPEIILRNSGQLIYADVALVTRDSKGESQMRNRRVYWSQAQKKWLPMELNVVNQTEIYYEIF